MMIHYLLCQFDQKNFHTFKKTSFGVPLLLNAWGFNWWSSLMWNVAEQGNHWIGGFEYFTYIALKPWCKIRGFYLSLPWWYIYIECCWPYKFYTHFHEDIIRATKFSILFVLKCIGYCQTSNRTKFYLLKFFQAK